MTTNSIKDNAKNEQTEIVTISTTSSLTTTNYNDNNITKESPNSPFKKLEEESDSEPPKKKRGRKKKVEDEEESDFEPPKKKRGRKKKVESEEESNSEPPKKKRGRKKKLESEEESHSEPPKKKRGRKKKLESDRTTKEGSVAKWVNGIFKDLRIFIIPQNIDRVRLEFLKSRIKERGGSVLEAFVILDVTHVITELKGKKVIQALNLNKVEELLEHGIKVINANWVSDSIMYNKLLEIDNYVVHLNVTRSRDATIDTIQVTSNSKRKLDEKDETTITTNTDEIPANYNSGSDFGNTSQDPLKEIIAEARHLTEEGIYSDEEDDDYDQEESNTSTRHHKSINATESTGDESTTSHYIANTTSDSDNDQRNKPVSPINKTGEGEIFRLKTTNKSYGYRPQNSFFHYRHGAINENPNKLIIDKLNLILEYYQKTNNDQWRILAYRKAISALKNQKKPITSYEEAKEIPNIGDRTAKKIAEIIETGHLKRLDNFGEAEPVLTMFTKIHGVGVTQALKWYAQGYRTREELLKHVKLTNAQRAGILCFEDLQERMNRYEVAKIFKFVEDAAHSIDSKLECIVGGSYRRGQPTCGDVDILITRDDSDGKKIDGILSQLLKILHEKSFIKYDLGRSSSGQKYLGICQMPPNGKCRRFDIFIVPFNEYGAALLAYTGNDIFNRSMRLLARKKGMHLNQHGLYTNVIRDAKDEKYNEGILVAQRTEQEIFEALGVPYR
ncbi:679_t:CDS:10 [Ambispora leptoticha]|uniref:DNA polymerase lambda n=1 Tax=Ambispora leptoticha TaxID=144679 RepID=A0A9N9FJU6_9GLOM|nr:679_t:CDS:10 [Ambispora leptoticha]